MFETSVSHVSHGEFAPREKSKKACLGKPLPVRERERERERKESGKRRFCDQCCRVDVKEKSTEQY